jgi:uncharacterized transporter YbjL
VQTSTPPELVAAYESLADSILAAKKAEWNLVHSILATTFGHAEAVYLQALAKMRANQDARAEAEKLATLISQIANEGDAAVARVRKRLLEGGHHHNAAGEQQGIYDKGYVIVTRAAKKALLEAAGAIAKLGRAEDVTVLESRWQAVSAQYNKLTETSGR